MSMRIEVLASDRPDLPLGRMDLREQTFPEKYILVHEIAVSCSGVLPGPPLTWGVFHREPDSGTRPAGKHPNRQAAIDGALDHNKALGWPVLIRGFDE